MVNQVSANTLNHDSLLDGISFLSEIDPDLKRVINEMGNPPLWSREPGFATLIHIILEQQVSLASAQATFTKLKEASKYRLTPKHFLEFSDSELNKFGFSRQKTAYCQELSKEILNENLELDNLHHLDDSKAKLVLMKIKGIGPWTANIYLLMALLRPDVWPSGDLAVKKAILDIKDLSKTPDSETIDKIALQWKPWRAVAVRILWHYYLNKPSKVT